MIRSVRIVRIDGLGVFQGFRPLWSYGWWMAKDPLTSWLDKRLAVLGQAVAIGVANELAVDAEKIAAAVTSEVLESLGGLPDRLESVVKTQLGSLQAGLSQALIAAMKGLFGR